MTAATVSTAITRGVSIASLANTVGCVASMATTPSAVLALSTAVDLNKMSAAERSIRITSSIGVLKHATAVVVRSLALSVRWNVPLPHSEVHVLLVRHRGPPAWAADPQPVGHLPP